MSTIRKNPPPLAPSRIAGTLKVRKPAAEDATEAAPAAPVEAGDAPERRRRGADDAARRERDDRPRRAPEPRRTGAPRKAGAEGAQSRPPASRRAGTEAREPARRERPPAAGRPARDSAAGGAATRGAPQAPTTRRAERAERTPAGAGTRARPQAEGEPRKRPPAPAAPTPARPQEGTGAAAEGVRLSKLMAERGLCSRREADEYIARGWVFVDGRRVSELGTRIEPDARITLAPEATRTQRQRVTILLHKPVGYVSGQPEPGYAPAVSLIGADNQFDRDSAQRFHPSQLKNLAPAGRLDIDSTGLLVLTQDGRVARQLIGEDSSIDKEYLVRVEGELAENGLALLNHGLWLDDRPLRPAQVEWINDDQLRFVLREGRKRQIRRMCELVGLKVVGLKRVRIGRVKLGELPLGQWRFLREDERFD